VVGEVQVVQPLEALAERTADHLLHLAALRIEREQPAPVIGDECSAIPVKLQPIGPAVVLHRKIPLALCADAEDAPIRDIDAPEVPLPVERRPLEEAVERRALAVGDRPGAAALL